MNKTSLLSLSFKFVLTCLSGIATWVHCNHQWCSLSDNGFLFQELEHDSHEVPSFSQDCIQIEHSIYLLLTLKNVLLRMVPISKSTCPHHHIFCLFLWLLNRGPKFSSKSFSISFTFDSFTCHGTILVVIMTMMSANSAIAFVTLTKTFVVITKNLKTHFPSAALVLAFIAQFHQSWSVL